jgi:hypothetical protein
MTKFEFHYKDCVGKVKWEHVQAESEPKAYLVFDKAHCNEVVTVLEVFLADDHDFDEL